MVTEQLQRVAGHRRRHSQGPGEAGDHAVGRFLRAGGRRSRVRHEDDLAAARGDLHRQPGLAGPAGPDQGHQPAGRVVEQPVQPDQLVVAADQAGERPGRAGGRRRDRGSAELGEPAGGRDLVAQGHGGRRRRDPQLLPQQVAAGFVLGQGGTAVAAPGQEPHQRPVGLLLQRFEREHPAAHLDAGVRVVLRSRPPHGPFQQGEHVRPVRGAAGRQPLVEDRGAGHAEAGQELTAAEPGSREHRIRIRSGAGRPGHLRGVHPDRAGQRHRLPGRLQMVRQDPAHLAQHEPQVGPRGRLGQVAPEQTGQRRARMPGAGHREVVDQRGPFGGGRLREGTPAHAQLGCAEHADA